MAEATPGSMGTARAAAQRTTLGLVPDRQWHIERGPGLVSMRVEWSPGLVRMRISWGPGLVGPRAGEHEGHMGLRAGESEGW